MKSELLPDDERKTASVEVWENIELGAKIRSVQKDGATWFMAADVCRALALENSSMAMERLDDDEHTLISTEGIAGAKNPMATVVSESGLYALTLGSRKPEAKAFKRWVTHDVIPAIRKTGSYSMSPQPFKLPSSFAEALRLAADQSEQIEQQKKQLAIAAPKVAAQNLLEGAGGLFGVREAGKQVGMGQKAFVAMLLSKKIMYRLGGDLVPYQTMIDRGFFQTTTGTAVHGDDVHAWKQAKFTAKGIAWIAEKVASVP